MSMPSVRRRRGETTTRYWDHALVVAALIAAVVGLRVHENVPYVAVLRPAAVIAYGGGLLLLVRSPQTAIEAAGRDPTMRIALAYFAWIACTAPFALWPGLAIGTLQVGPPVLVLVGAFLLCAPDLKRMEGSALAFCVSAAVLGALALLLRATVMDAGTERLSEQGSLDANDLAAAMAMAFPFAIGLAVRPGTRRRMLGLGIAIVCVLAVVRSGSRGGTLALGVAALAYALGLKGTKRVAVIATLVVAGFVGWSVAPEGFKSRITGIGSEDYNYTEYSGRKQIWSRGRGYLIEHPVTGVGAGNFPVAEGDYAAALGRPAKWSAAHNTYLQAFVELGIIGGMLLMALLGLSIRRAWGLWKGVGGAAWHRPEYLAAMLAFCTSAFFLSHAYFYPLFALCGIIALADRALNRAIGAVVPQQPSVPRVWRGLGRARAATRGERAPASRRLPRPAAPAPVVRPDA